MKNKEFAAYIADKLGIVRMRQDYILVDPDPDRNMHRMKGPDGEPLDIIIDTSYSKRHNSISGRIVSLPRRLTKELGFSVDHLEVGDRVYFHFNSISIAKEAGNMLYDKEGYGYCVIPCGMMYCAMTERYGLQMIGGWMLVRPVMEGEKQTDSGIVVQVGTKARYLEGTVCYIGDNTHGEARELEVGDHIYYDTDCDIEIVVEGETYYRQHQKDILAKIC